MSGCDYECLQFVVEHAGRPDLLPPKPGYIDQECAEKVAIEDASGDEGVDFQRMDIDEMFNDEGVDSAGLNEAGRQLKTEGM
jgi:hypothetical protein